MSKDFLKILYIACLALIILLPAAASAGGVSPYLPLNKSPEIERQIERVMILAGRPVMTRPIPVALVIEALHDAREKDEELCAQVEQYLLRYMHETGLTQLRAELTLDAGDSQQVLPNQYGKTVESSWQVSGEFLYQPSEYSLISLGGIAYDGHSTPTGSMLSVGMDYAQLDIGYREHWLSPFTDSSMLLSTEATTMPSVTLSNVRPITALGISYQVYLAEMSESDHILYQDRFTTGKPRLGGIHLQVEPVAGYAISLNRQLQFGGGGRNQSLSDFISAFFNPAEYDNPSGKDSWRYDFGNQQASLTARMMFPGKPAFAVYFEFAGEDTSRYQNYLLGNTSFSFGIDFPSLLKKFDFTYETSEWQNRWYLHHIYSDGLLNNGSVIGHWFGDQRLLNDDAGGISHILRFGWQAGDGDYVQAMYRTLRNNAYTSLDYENMQELGLAYSFSWKGHMIGAGLSAGSDIAGSRYLRLSTSLNFGQGWTGTTTNAVSSTSDVDDRTDLFVDIGVASGNIKAYCGSFPIENNDKWIRYSSDPHLGFGVRRSISEHGDLGTRIEWDRINGRSLLSLRIADYRYRFSNHFAMNCFLGVGRYSSDTPAYGWYLGIGPQFLDVFKEWDLSADARLHLKMSHDKVIKKDPSEFYTAEAISSMGVAVYISHRF